jgi:hypothetical protein
VAGRETRGYIAPVRRIVAENDLPLDQFPEQGAPRIKEVVT